MLHVYLCDLHKMNSNCVVLSEPLREGSHKQDNKVKTI
jgi:hypothetical protein